LKLQNLFETLEFDHILHQLSSLTVTSLGRERIKDLQPQLELNSLEESLSVVTELRRIIDFESIPLEPLDDIRPALKRTRIEAHVLNIEECIQIYRFCRAVRILDLFFKQRDESLPILVKLISGFRPLKPIEDSILTCIDLESLEIKDTASKELATIRKQIRQTTSSTRRKIESKLKTLAQSGMLQENVISVRNERFVLVVKSQFVRKVKGLVHDQSATGSSFFIEPMEIVEDNNRIRELQSREQKEIRRILTGLTDKIRAHDDELSQNLIVYGRLDYIHAKAQFSRSLNAVQPELAHEPIVELVDARHPSLVLRLGQASVVPMSITLNSEKSIYIISGPNAGGKTVALKTIGLCALMTLCGLHIPAQPQTKIGMLNHIFANIGDQQSLENDLSTFSSHLQGLKTIADQADNHSLVLIDEITVGTDPEEGNALAMAFLEHMTKIHALTIVTTHHGPLKAFAYQTKGVENASLEFDVSSLLPTYKFRTGIPGSSYAFEIAQRLGLSQRITQRARELVHADKQKLEGLILELESKVQKYTKLTYEADRRETEYRGLQKLYHEQQEQLKKETDEIKKRAAEQADTLLKDTNALIEAAIRQIRESQADKDIIRESRQSLVEHAERVKRIKKRTRIKNEPIPDPILTFGDFVRWETTGNQGRVISVMDNRHQVLVEFDNGMKVNIDSRELRKIEQKKRKPSGFVRVNSSASETLTQELDLRGLTSEEALEELDHFLDEAVLAGFFSVRIIHGKGTGKLRQSVGKYLQRHSQVETFRLGHWNEGQAGVTVVELQKK